MSRKIGAIENVLGRKEEGGCVNRGVDARQWGGAGDGVSGRRDIWGGGGLSGAWSGALFDADVWLGGGIAGLRWGRICYYFCFGK